MSQTLRGPPIQPSLLVTRLASRRSQSFLPSLLILRLIPKPFLVSLRPFSLAQAPPSLFRLSLPSRSLLEKVLKKFGAVEVFRGFLGIVNVLITLLFNQVLLLISLFPSFQYLFYFVFAFIILQLDIIVYNDLGRSLSQFQ